MGKRKHVWGSAVGGLALVVLTAGCGSESGSGDGEFGDRSAPENVTGDQAPTVTRGAAAAVSAAVDNVHANGSVAATMTMTLAGGKEAEIETRVKLGDPGGVRMTMNLGEVVPGDVPGEDATIDALVTPTTMYMNFGADLGAESGGRNWVRIDYADLEAADPTGALAGIGELLGGGLRQQDPTRQLSLLKGTTEVTEVGTETIDGVPADHYAATLDRARIEALSGKQLDVSEETLRLIRDANRQLGVTSTSIDVWVDPKTGLPVRQSVRTMTGAGAGAGAGAGDTVVTIDYRDWGLTVDLTPPSPDETMDFAELMDASEEDASS